MSSSHLRDLASVAQEFALDSGIAGVQPAREKVLELWEVRPNQRGGAQKWRTALGACMRVCRKALGCESAAPRFVLRELTAAGRSFTGHSCRSWRPRVIMCLLVLGHPAHLVEALAKVCMRDWEAALADGCRRARQFIASSRTCGVGVPEVAAAAPVAPALPDGPRTRGAPDTAENLASRSEIDRVLEARTVFAILGTQVNPSKGDVQKAFRRSALLVHPDKCGNVPGSAQAFAALQAARELALRFAQP